MATKYVLPEGSLISFFSNKVKQFGGINLAQGLPGFQPPYQLTQILSETALRKDIHQYAPGIGNFLLIEHIVSHYNKHNTISNNEVLITQGATEAITLVYLYLKQSLGKLSVLGFSPVYESYNNLPKIFGDQFIAFDIKNNEIDFDELEQAIKLNKINLLFINSPGNPLGRINTKHEIDKIIELSAKYSIYVIVDAVYRELYYNTPPYIPFDNSNSYLFYVNSFSKLYSITGWRVGYLICNEKHMKKIRTMHDYTGLCVSNPIQTAIAEYISRYGFINEYVTFTRENVYYSFSYFSNILKEMNFEIPQIDGGYFIWAKLPDSFADGFEFAVDFYETYKVAIIPGIHFSEKGSKHVRFNIAHPIEIIEQVSEKLKQFIQEKS